jgi:hypothetical protein
MIASIHSIGASASYQPRELWALKRVFLAFLVFGFSVAAQVSADPLYSKNLAPVVGLFGFPNLRNAAPMSQGSFGASLNASIANNYTVDVSAQESVNFDGETRRASLNLRYGLASGWELEAEVPWLRHEGGDLDKVIEDWHDLWNLPDGNRDDVPRDLIDIRYRGPGAAFELSDSVSGLGDINLALVREVWSDEGAAASIRAGVKFATGDEDDLLGSGSEDFYLSLNLSGRQRSDLPLVWHGQVGYLRAGDADILGSIAEQDLWFAGIGMEWRAWETVHLKLQIDSNAATADSKLDQLGDPSVQLTAGLSWEFVPRWELDLGFSEDISVDTAPDFVVQFGVRFRGR